MDCGVDMRPKVKPATTTAAQHTLSEKPPLSTPPGSEQPIPELPVSIQIVVLVASAAWLGVLLVLAVGAAVDLLHRLQLI